MVFWSKSYKRASLKGKASGWVLDSSSEANDVLSSKSKPAMKVKAAERPDPEDKPRNPP